LLESHRSGIRLRVGDTLTLFSGAVGNSAQGSRKCAVIPCKSVYSRTGATNGSLPFTSLSHKESHAVSEWTGRQKATELGVSRIAPCHGAQHGPSGREASREESATLARNRHRACEQSGRNRYRDRNAHQPERCSNSAQRAGPRYFWSGCGARIGGCPAPEQATVLIGRKADSPRLSRNGAPIGFTRSGWAACVYEPKRRRSVP